MAVKGGQYTVMVDKARFADAINILKEAGLPKQEFQSMGQVFKKDGLISSPTQERAQMIFALSQELSRTVSEIDGVLSARVHLVLPENDAAPQLVLRRVCLHPPSATCRRAIGAPGEDAGG